MLQDVYFPLVLLFSSACEKVSKKDGIITIQLQYTYYICSKYGCQERVKARYELSLVSLTHLAVFLVLDEPYDVGDVGLFRQLLQQLHAVTFVARVALLLLKVLHFHHIWRFLCIFQGTYLIIVQSQYLISILKVNFISYQKSTFRNNRKGVCAYFNGGHN